MGGAPVAGVIEGFYGRPWSWDERLLVCRHVAERGMTHYLYAPKDDPKHRAEWRVPYDRDELAGFERLVAEAPVTVGFAVSPGLSMDYGSPEDRQALAAKLDALLAVGVGFVCLALDDIPRRPGLGEAHAEVTTWLRDHVGDRALLVLVPTDYVGCEASDYLDALAAGVPGDVPIAWTGMSVVNDAITVAEARRRAGALGGRAPLLWDNYPVNDAVMADRLFTGPLRGREPGLFEACSGYLANPMVQPRCSLLPLASVAAWLRGEDPEAAWAAEAGALRTFAEACDGAEPRRLVAALTAAVGDPRGADRAEALAAVRAWFDAAAGCEAPGLEGEADAWVTQIRTEAAVGVAACRLLRRVWGDEPDPDRVLAAAFGVAVAWQAARKGDVTVLGPRWAFRPALAQRADGAWRLLPEALQEDQNALDVLCRLALAEAAALA